MEECNICIEVFNKTTRRKIKCHNPTCGYIYCSHCLKYMVKNSVQHPTCPACNEQYTTDFIEMYMPSIYCSKDFRNKITELFIEQQKLLIPESGFYIEKYMEYLRAIKNIELIDKKLTKYGNKYSKYKERRNKLCMEARKNNIKKYHDLPPIENICKKMKTVLDKYQHYSRLKYEEKSKDFSYISYRYWTNGNVQEDISTQGFPCPIEGCNHFVYNGKCSVCETYVCSSCREPKKSYKDSTHVCDPLLVESINDINKNSKPCPKCRIPIHKTYGCDHMWCSVCHTMFSWKTGKIQQHTSNPHYYEWLREHGGEQRVVEQNEEYIQQNFCYTFDEILDYIIRLYDSGYITGYQESELRYMFAHLCNFILGDQVITEISNYTQFKILRLRVEYSIGVINEKTWMTKIKTILKTVDKNNEYVDVCRSFYECALYILQGEPNTAMRSINELILFTNQRFKVINKRYNMVVDYFTPIY